MTVPTYVGDSVIVDVTVYSDEAKTVVKDITGGTVTASIRSPTGGDTTVTAAITDAANGVARFTLPLATTDAAGTWLFQLELVIGSESQTVFSEAAEVSQAIKTT